MKRITAVIAAVLLAGLVAPAQRRGFFRGYSASSLPQAGSETEKRILDVIREAGNAGRVFENVPPADGRMLRLLAEATNAKSVVEIGASTGVSGLWLSLALQATGGKLTTFEIDPQRASAAREHFRKAGVDSIVTLVEGDAHARISQLTAPLDMVFIDADKDGYLDYLEKLLPLVRPGGLILAHNVNMSPEYMRAVTSNPALETLVYSEGGGLGVTLKKR